MKFFFLLKKKEEFEFLKNNKSFERLSKDSNRRRQQKIPKARGAVGESALLMQEKQLNITELKVRYNILTLFSRIKS